MIKIGNVTYIKIERILEEKTSITQEVEDLMKDIDKVDATDISSKIQAMKLILSSMVSKDHQLVQLLSDEKNKRIPALFRNY